MWGFGETDIQSNGSGCDCTHLLCVPTTHAIRLARHGEKSERFTNIAHIHVYTRVWSCSEGEVTCRSQWEETSLRLDCADPKAATHTVAATLTSNAIIIGQCI